MSYSTVGILDHIKQQMGSLCLITDGEVICKMTCGAYGETFAGTRYLALQEYQGGHRKQTAPPFIDLRNGSHASATGEKLRLLPIKAFMWRARVNLPMQSWYNRFKEGFPLAQSRYWFKERFPLGQSWCRIKEGFPLAQSWYRIKEGFPLTHSYIGLKKGFLSRRFSSRAVLI